MMATEVALFAMYKGGVDGIRSEIRNLARGVLLWEETEITSGYQFCCNYGGVITWYPASGIVLFQGKVRKAERLKKLWDARSHVDKFGYGEPLTVNLGSHNGIIQVSFQGDDRFQIQAVTGPEKISIMITLVELKLLIEKLSQCAASTP